MTNTTSLPAQDPVALRQAGHLALPPADLLHKAALFLDFDGTLVDLAERPDLVQVPPALPALLRQLSTHLDGRLALVSGRGAQQIAAIIGDPGIIIAGSHGAELRFGSGHIVAPLRDPALDEALAQMNDLARRNAGVLVENKPQGVALHYRTAPDAAQPCHALALELAQKLGLLLQTGKMVVELRAAGHDKGTAVRRLMQEPAMIDTRPVFIGDDDTDEAAFHAVTDLGGVGILVGPPRETAASYRLPTVAAVHLWLNDEVAR